MFLRQSLSSTKTFPYQGLSCGLDDIWMCTSSTHRFKTVRAIIGDNYQKTGLETGLIDHCFNPIDTDNQAGTRQRREC
jgi:hypothetical protein